MIEISITWFCFDLLVAAWVGASVACLAIGCCMVAKDADEELTSELVDTREKHP